MEDRRFTAPLPLYKVRIQRYMTRPAYSLWLRGSVYRRGILIRVTIACTAELALDALLTNRKCVPLVIQPLLSPLATLFRKSVSQVEDETWLKHLADLKMC